MIAKTYPEKRFFDWEEDDVSVSLRACSGSYGGGQRSPHHLIYTDIVGSLQARDFKGAGNQYVEEGKLVIQMQKVTGSLMASGYNKNGTQEAMSGMYVVGKNWDGSQTSPTLTSNNAGGGQRMPDKDNFNAVIQTLETKDVRTADERSHSLRARDYKDPQCVTGQSVVRRLTPMECERLQGYPDGWTDIGEWVDTKGKVHKESSDAARYKALGNSIALPFWFWLLRRISAQYERPATLGSLFDGIGGFPLCWEMCNGKGTALWASEIEEFPIAVTKYHFGEPDE